jgi:outer membrane protein assembly factor BamB
MAILMFTTGCAGRQLQPVESVGKIPEQIRQNLVVSGDVRVRGEVKVFPGAVLTVLPGTRFFFEPYDGDGDGVLDSRLVIEGTLIARGTPQEPIVFTSGSEDPQPGDWLEIRSDRSEGTVLEYCVLEYSRYGLHVHFSSGVVANSILRRNMDASRFGNSRFLVHRNLIEGNLGKGINYRESRLIVSNNVFADNRHGIFVFEKGSEALIGHNLFRENRISDLRFGDFYTGENPLLEDNRRSDGLPLTVVGAPLAPGLAPKSGSSWSAPGPMRRDIITSPVWETDLSSFIDVSPILLDSGRIAVMTWTGHLVQVSVEDGRVLEKTEVGDIVDATPALFMGNLIFPSWDRHVRSVNPANGRVEGDLTWDPSPADDHRQASPRLIPSSAFGRPMLIQGLWNGELTAIDPEDLKWLWRTSLDGPIRSMPAYSNESLWVGTDEGTLFEVNFKGEVLGRVPLGSPVRTTPSVFGPGDVAVVSRDGVLFRIRDGAIVWRRKLPGQGTYASPLAAGMAQVPILIFTGDGSGAVSAFDGEGALMWRTVLSAAVHSLGFRGRILWAGTGDGRLLALDPVTGSILAALKAEGAVHAPPLQLGGLSEKIIWVSRDGIVRAHRLQFQERPWDEE